MVFVSDIHRFCMERISMELYLIFFMYIYNTSILTVSFDLDLVKYGKKTTQDDTERKHCLLPLYWLEVFKT